MIVRRVGVGSLGKVCGAIYGVLGFIAGVIVTLGSALAGNADNPAAAVVLMGAIIIFPIVYGIGGWILGALTAVIYNWVAGAVGGIELEFEEMGPVTPA